MIKSSMNLHRTSDTMRLTRAALRVLFDVPISYIIIVARASPVARSRFEFVLN